jgi:hypothetical protein
MYLALYEQCEALFETERVYSEARGLLLEF